MIEPSFGRWESSVSLLNPLPKGSGNLESAQSRPAMQNTCNLVRRPQVTVKGKGATDDSGSVRGGDAVRSDHNHVGSDTFFNHL